MDKNGMLTQSAILDRGWTKSMLKLLPPPVQKQNPRYKKAAPMKMWKVADVEEAEASIEWQEKRRGRINVRNVQKKPTPLKRRT